eukprot:2751753-Rhodomonas_salina.1
MDMDMDRGRDRDRDRDTQTHAYMYRLIQPQQQTHTRTSPVCRSLLCTRRRPARAFAPSGCAGPWSLSLIHISEPTRPRLI